MSKKKLRSKAKPIFAESALARQLDEIAALAARKQWVAARAKLEPLVMRNPNRVELLEQLVNICYAQKDMRGYQDAIERLARLVGDDPDVALGLAGAYLGNLRPLMAVRVFRRFLQRWPEHGRAAEVRKTTAELEQAVEGLLAEFGLSGDEGLELALLHEEAQVELDAGRYTRARKLEEQIVRRDPHFAPALNNISLTFWAEGKIAQALSAAQRVLEFAPDNYHARANLTRYLLLSGRAAEALQSAERLKAIATTEGDVWVKKAEALSLLGDDAGVLAVMEAAQQQEHFESPVHGSMLYHLAAVAAWRLGREGEARQYWQQALKQPQTEELVRANQADLRKPIGARDGPWPFPIYNWLPERTIRELLQLLDQAGDHEHALGQATHRFLQRHPEVGALVPHLLDRGDPLGREIAFRTASMARTPELLAALHDFAFSQRGPDSMRHQAAQVASEAGLMPQGPTRLWLKGEWQEVLLLNVEVIGDAVLHHSPEVEGWLAEPPASLRRNDAETAERLLLQALAVERDAPDVINNLAATYEFQGRTAEAMQLVSELHRRKPDYLFARTALAHFHTSEGRYEEADALLKPLFERKRLHYSELAAFAKARIELEIARNRPDVARSWLDMWAMADPEHPELAATRQQIEAPGLARKLLGGLRFRR